MFKLFNLPPRFMSPHPLLLFTSFRAFTRADIHASLDRTKVNRRLFIKKELTDNPEFFKAFPHMQTVFGAIETGKRDNEMSAEALNKDATPYQHDKQLSFKDPNA